MFWLFLLPVLIFGTGSLEALRRYEEDTQIQIREIRDTLEDLKREVRNHEIEMKAIEERSHSIDGTLDSIRAELKETHQAQKEITKNNLGNLEMKIGSLETNSKGLTSDVKQIRNSFNESQDTLKAFKDRIGQLEESIRSLNSNMKLLEQALNTVLDAIKLEAGSVPVSPGGKTYRVKPGDSLEKIAKQNGITVKEIRRLNNMAPDQNQIRVNQLLKLAE